MPPRLIELLIALPIVAYVLWIYGRSIYRTTAGKAAAREELGLKPAKITDAPIKRLFESFWLTKTPQFGSSLGFGATSLSKSHYVEASEFHLGNKDGQTLVHFSFMRYQRFPVRRGFHQWAWIVDLPKPNLPDFVLLGREQLSMHPKHLATELFSLFGETGIADKYALYAEDAEAMRDIWTTDAQSWLRKNRHVTIEMKDGVALMGQCEEVAHLTGKYPDCVPPARWIENYYELRRLLTLLENAWHERNKRSAG